MEEVIESMENISALLDSIAILAVAPVYGAGDLPPQSLQRVVNIAAFLCKQLIVKMDQSTLEVTDIETAKQFTIEILKKAL